MEISRRGFLEASIALTGLSIDSEASGLAAILQDVEGRVNALIKARKFDEAEQLVAGAYAQESADKCFLLSKVYAHAGRYGQARTQVDKVLQYEPDGLRGLRADAMLDILQGKPRIALDKLGKLAPRMTSAPEKAAWEEMCADAHSILAEETYRRALTTRLPGGFKVMEEAVGHYDGAFKKQAHRDNPTLREGRGSMLVGMKQFDRAKEDYTAAMLLAPKSASGYAGFAHTYLRAGEAHLVTPAFLKLDQGPKLSHNLFVNGCLLAYDLWKADYAVNKGGPFELPMKLPGHEDTTAFFKLLSDHQFEGWIKDTTGKTVSEKFDDLRWRTAVEFSLLAGAAMYELGRGKNASVENSLRAFDVLTAERHQAVFEHLEKNLKGRNELARMYLEPFTFEHRQELLDALPKR